MEKKAVKVVHEVRSVIYPEPTSNTDPYIVVSEIKSAGILTGYYVKHFAGMYSRNDMIFVGGVLRDATSREVANPPIPMLENVLTAIKAINDSIVPVVLPETIEHLNKQMKYEAK